MLRTLTQMLAFAGKEFNDVRRQPRLVLISLVGPLLILGIFGIGYRSVPGPLRMAIVIPENLQGESLLQNITDSLEPTFDIIYVGSDETLATNLLFSNQVDIVEVIPPDWTEYAARGEQVPIEVIYNEIDPQREQYIRSVSVIQVTAVNRFVLLDNIANIQGELDNVEALVDEAGFTLDTLELVTSDEDLTLARERLESVREALALVSTVPTGLSSSQTSDLASDVAALEEDLLLLEIALAEDNVDDLQTRIDSTRERLNRLDESLTLLRSVDPVTIVSPLAQQNRNLSGDALDLTTFYAPGVAVLILQHTAVTLAGLSLVKEKERGSLEFFGASPISPLQVLIGKYVAYFIFIGVLTAALVLLLVFALGVPFAGSPLEFAAFSFVFLAASLGVGFVLSALSRRDTQAVQLSMLVLLLTIFFSGFVLPFENFYDAIQILATIIPTTHGMQGYREIMLQAAQPSTFEWASLTTIAVLSFITVSMLWSRQSRRFE